LLLRINGAFATAQSDEKAYVLVKQLDMVYRPEVSLGFMPMIIASTINTTPPLRPAPVPHLFALAFRSHIDM
jgi:hypothetical protein